MHLRSILGPLTSRYMWARGVGRLEASSTVDLDGGIDHELGSFGGKQFGGGGHPGQSLPVPAVVSAGGLIHHQPGRIDPHRHVRELVGDTLEAGQRLAECFPGGRMGNRQLQSPLCHPDREGSHRGPEEIKGPHRHSKTVTDFAD